MTTPHNQTDHRDDYPSGQLDPQAMNRLIRHRLRNLCAGGKMTLDRIADKAGTPAVHEKCTVLKAEFDNLELFTRRMDLVFDRLPEPTPLPLFELLTHARQAFARKFPLCALKFDGPELAVTLPRGSWADLAIAELLANAGEAAGTEGAVSLRWERQSDGGMTLAVDNTGLPIPSEIPLSPPKPFHTTRGRHDGLGLPIAHRIAKTLEGGLEISSNRQDSICVVFQLPRLEIYDG